MEPLNPNIPATNNQIPVPPSSAPPKDKTDKVFSPEKPCENVHTQKNRLAFYEPEPDYWIHVSIELGYAKKTIKDKDGKQKSVIEFLDTNLHEASVRRMLKKGYEMYRLFNGPFDLTVRTSGVKTLKNKLEEFFGNWVFEWNFEKAELTKTIDGVIYLPLSNAGESAVVSFVTKVQADYSFISQTFVLWQDKLLYGGDGNITDADIREIWRHLVSLSEVRENKNKEEAAEKLQKNKESDKYLLPSLKGFSRAVTGTNFLSYFSNTSSTSLDAPVDTLKGSENSTSPISPLPVASIPSNFLTGPTKNLDGCDKKITPLIIYLKKPSNPNSTIFNKQNGHEIDEDEEDEEVEEYYLVVYKENFITLAFLILVNSPESSSCITDIVFYRSLQEYLSSRIDQVTNLVNEDNERMKKIGKPDAHKEYRYLFYNKLTMAIKSSINSTSTNSFSWPSTPPRVLTISNEMANVLCEVYEDFERCPQLTEIYTKASSNFWVIGKRFEERYLYVIVSKKEATLLEVEEDVRRLTALYFSGLFME
ncbi:hypothetical protein G9A89_020676 [Geosiphon pyriformis]|nr:hypothetical protein G9A89_020676 [Geosiphon pyriformis]